MKQLLQFLNALGLVIASMSGAQAIPLQVLIDGESIIAGDKLFDQWELVDLFTTDPILDPDLSNIEVTALNDGGLDPGPGLLFNANDELSVRGDDIFAFIDLSFGFRISTLADLKIKDNSLTMEATLNTATLIPDDLGVFIQEDIGTAPGLDDLGTKDVELSFLNPGPVFDKLVDSAVFDPQDEIFVNKNILVWATFDHETAILQEFTQRFSQVPEPGTIALLACGLAGIVFARRKQVCKAIERKGTCLTGWLQ